MTTPINRDHASAALGDEVRRWHNAGRSRPEILTAAIECVAPWPDGIRPSTSEIEACIAFIAAGPVVRLPDSPLAVPPKLPAHNPANDEVEHYLRGPLDESDPVHAVIVCAILDGLKERGLSVDANGSFRDAASWSRVDGDHGTIGREVAFKIRSKGTRVDSARVTETLEVIAATDAKSRRYALYAEHLECPANPAGEVELRRWVAAVTGAEREADVQVMRHWLWLVKNRVAGRHGEMHVMPVVFGLKQGSGKSQAVMKLCSPWCELFNPDFAMESITDERCAPALARTVIGLWDELGGLARTDMEKLKHRLTGAVVRYRPMRSNSEVELPMLTSLIGTSNRRLIDLARDATGARRFYEIEAADEIDWASINGINYNLLWQAVNENEPGPGTVHREIIAVEQTKLVWRDPIVRWLADEESEGWPVVASLDGSDLGSAKPMAGVATALLYDRFRRWCADAGEREVTREIMGRRLTELGWVQFQLPRSEGRKPGYRRPLIEGTAPAALATHGHQP